MITNLEVSSLCAVCGLPATCIAQNGRTIYCPKHLRIKQMRGTARRYGKVDPGREYLEGLADDLVCRDCGRAMNWLQIDGISTQVTLQHYRDGTIALVCFSCNCRHGNTDEGAFRRLTPGNKYCPRCDSILPNTSFYSIKGRLGGYCRNCTKNYNKTHKAGVNDSASPAQIEELD